MIENIVKEMFVAVSAHDPGIVPGYSEYTYIYPTSSSPNPMKDWTIKSISIYKWAFDVTYWHGADYSVSDLIDNATLLKKYEKIPTIHSSQ